MSAYLPEAQDTCGGATWKAARAEPGEILANFLVAMFMVLMFNKHIHETQ
jgi:hypothetical protein